MSEAQVQQQIVDAARALGFHVYSLSQGYRPGSRRHATTRQTKGLSDLFLIHRARALQCWIEVKGEKTKVTPEQVVFQERVQRAGGHAAIVRSVEELAEFLAPLGFTFEVRPRLVAL